MDEGHLALKALMETNYTLSKSRSLSRQEQETALLLFQTLFALRFDFSQPIQLHSDEYKELRKKSIQKLYPNESFEQHYLLHEEALLPQEYLKNDPEKAEWLMLLKKQLW